MLKTQELDIDGVKFTIREPRIVDHMRASDASRGSSLSGDEYALQMLGCMLLDANGVEVGAEFVRLLPLRYFGILSDKMNSFEDRQTAPLGSSAGASSG